MKIAGETAKRDLTYKISVDEELSTVEDKHYSLPETTVFSKGVYHDTCYVRLNKTADLSNRAVRLVLRLEATSDMEVGKLDNAVAIIQISNTVARPSWWDSNIEQYYLGAYSQKKFVLFLEVTGADLTDANDSEKRAYALEFKQYLIDHRGPGFDLKPERLQLFDRGHTVHGERADGIPRFGHIGHDDGCEPVYERVCYGRVN